MRRVSLLAGLAALLLAAPASGATGLLAIGDFGVGGDAERAMGAAVRRFEATHAARLLVTLGDNDYTQSPEAFRADWRASFGWLPGAGVGVAGTLGNHDVEVDEGRYELGLLSMPGPYYTRRVGRIELFVLNSNDVGQRQTAWLRRSLEHSTARWRIAVFHHPAWSCGSYHGASEIVRFWSPLFERYGVQLVLNGHDHNYQRFAPRRGVLYVVHGGGGQRLYPLNDCPAGYPAVRFRRSTHGFLYLSAGRDVLTGSSVTLRGAVIDAFRIYP